VKGPAIRTCLGCRQARPKADLVRLARTASGIVVADGGPRPSAGRGAYVCPELECLDRGLSPGRLGHAFRKPSQAAPDLTAEVQVRAAARRDADVARSRAAQERAPLCEVGARVSDDIEVIPLRV